MKVDNPDTWTRNTVSVTKDETNPVIVGSNYYDVDKLRAIVYKALKEGEGEQLLCESENDERGTFVVVVCLFLFGLLLVHLILN